MMNACISLDHANAMTDIVFAETFGKVAANASWVAEYALGIRPFLNRKAMVTAFTDGLFQAREDAQLELIRAHSMLCTGNVDSQEQNRFNERIAEYETAFGFPFIPASSDAGSGELTRQIEERRANSREEEFTLVLARIADMFRIRIESQICPDGQTACAGPEDVTASQEHRVPDWEPSR